MQPQYDIVWSDEFCADVTALCGHISVFDAAFAGHDWTLARIPRGKGTWDLSPTGDFRLAVLEGGRLEDGTTVPTIYFTFHLQLGARPILELLRAYRWDSEEFSGVLAEMSPGQL